VTWSTKSALITHIWDPAARRFRAVINIGADKKTLHCVDKIHFGLFRPPIYLPAASGHPQGFGSMLSNAPSFAAAPKSVPETTMREF
jgi:hypothetical protein